jgi:hypothetical protein
MHDMSETTSSELDEEVLRTLEELSKILSKMVRLLYMYLL